MSLKYFHIFFIATTMGLMAFLLYWSVVRLAGGARAGAVLACAAGMVAGLGYLRWFLRHYRDLR